MKVFENPSPEIWSQLILRAQAFEGEISAKVSEILQRVKREGDAALFDLTEKLDGVKLTKLFLGKEAKRFLLHLSLTLQQYLF